jgi:ubiquinone/menaquinone biosynthesis C-methylase UbiE
MDSNKTWESYWNQKKGNFLELYKNEEFIKGIASEVENCLKKGDSVLDLGCGDGIKTSRIAKKGFKVVGIDTSRTAIDKAKQNFQDLTFVVKDVVDENLPFGTNTFDAVTAISLLEYIKNKKEFLKEVKRVLKSNGILITITPNSKSPTIKFAWGFLIPVFETLKKEYKQPYYPFRKEDLIEPAKNMGFKVEKIKYLPVTYLVLPKILRPIFKNLGCLFKEEIVIVLKKV